MQNITINNHGTVNIISASDIIGEAKDDLLRKLYYARNKNTIGSYQGWKQLLDWYYAFEYNKMIDYLKSLSGAGGATRNYCISKIKIIMSGGKL